MTVLSALIRAAVPVLLLSFLGTACAVNRPGMGVTPELATEWGCDYQWIVERTARLKIELGLRRGYIPQVGWTVCELMARNGYPAEVDRSEVQDGGQVRWWYTAPGGRSLITLEYQDGWWIVTSVDWRAERP